MKSISTLVPDIKEFFESNAKLPEDRLKVLGEQITKVIHDSLTEDKRTELRMSNFGTKCDRKLWYQLNSPDDAERLDGWTKLQFLIGHIAEAVLLFAAEEKGHDVQGRQEEIELHGVKGHRDAIIDGVLVDVKTASPMGFPKFQNHQIEKDDPFGYLDQLGMYLEASKGHEALKVTGEAAFLATNKSSGVTVLDKYRMPSRDWKQEIEDKKEMLSEAEPPPRPYVPEPDGKSGNEQLPLQCRYCAFKRKCWPGLRTFQYSNGPRYLTRVVKLPEVPEIK